MTSTKAPHPLRRFILPVICALLALVTATQGEVLLVEEAGLPTLGPLVAAQVAVLATFSFSLLCVITLLLAIFPGGEQDEEDPDDPSVELQVDLDDPEDAEALADLIEATQTRSPDAIVAALKKSATKQAQQRQVEADRADEAEVRANAAETELAALRAGTSDEYKNIETRCREEANRDALRKVQDLSTAADRRAQALTEARNRVEAELAQRTAELDAKTQELQAAVARFDEERLAARSEGAADEFRRISIAIEAINTTSTGFMDPLQREAVDRHAQRISEALARLDPALSADFQGPVAMPPMSPPATEAEPAESGHKSAGKKRRFGKRKH